MAKKKRKKKTVAKPSPISTKYEDSNKYKAFDYMMRANRGICGPM